MPIPRICAMPRSGQSCPLTSNRVHFSCIYLLLVLFQNIYRHSSARFSASYPSILLNTMASGGQVRYRYEHGATCALLHMLVGSGTMNLGQYRCKRKRNAPILYSCVALRVLHNGAERTFGKKERNNDVRKRIIILLPFHIY